jgi:pimeloyl-ACP methyl ester carboxylesterase
MSNTRTIHHVTGFMLAILIAGSTGCTLIRAKKDLAILNQTVRICGTVTGDKPTAKPICVALYVDNPDGGRKILTACQVTYKDGAFAFQHKPNDYYLFAFEDANEDGAFQPTERIGWHGAPTRISAKPGEPLEPFKLELRQPDQARKELPMLYSNVTTHVEMRYAKRHSGSVISLSDPRFNPETGVQGMWEPMAFIEKYGIGLFFLQPYEEGKTPVLFVHGVGGTPRKFEPLISKLDRSRFQPWVLHYPSGIRLTLLADYFGKLLSEVQIRHKTPSIVVVAHSMGGLVARGTINILATNGKTFVPLFVSISSPWLGHPGAGAGVEHSPVVLPCWFDMSPGSPYLEALHKTPLPPTTSYYLLFGYQGDRPAFADGNSDGTLPISSMLDIAMQNAAINVFGFNENHVSILSSKDVSFQLNRILEKTVR